MLKRIALSLAFLAGAAALPVAAQAQECYRPHRVVEYGYRAPASFYEARAYQPPVVVYRAPAFGIYAGPAYVGSVGWRGRDWRAREWRAREWREHHRGYYR